MSEEPGVVNLAEVGEPWLDFLVQGAPNNLELPQVQWGHNLEEVLEEVLVVVTGLVGGILTADDPLSIELEMGLQVYLIF